MPRHTLLTAAILTGVPAASAQAQAQTLRVGWASHLPRAHDIGTVYAASCGEVKDEPKVARTGTGILPSAAERDRRACEGVQ